jgi:tRNA A37 threonylcarbamoyladenosine biosynthesis protein TsaE
MNCLSFINYTDDYSCIAKDILCNFSENDKLIIFLNGNMGAGKTSLCNAFGNVFNVFDLCSSSYGLVNFKQGSRSVIHSDFYRNTFSHDFFDEEVLPLLHPSFLLLMEWVPPIQLIREAVHLSITIRVNDDQNRVIQVSKI